MLNKTELEKLQSELPRNYYKKIIEVFKKNGQAISKTTIHRVLKGDSDRPDVIEAALKVITDKKKREQKLKARI